MKLIGLMLVRDEAWCAGFAARAALRWCDELVVLDHASADGSGELARAADPARVVVRPVPRDPSWREMDMRQLSLELGRDLGGTHFAVVDADEALTGNLLHTVRGMVEGLPPGGTLDLPMVATVRGLTVRRVDGVWGKRSGITLAFRDAEGVCWRAEGDGYQFHMRRPRGCAAAAAPLPWRAGGVFHFQYASERRLRAKAAWYKMAETLAHPGRTPARELNRKYDWTLDRGMEETAPVPAAWWEPHAAYREHLRPDDPPWQEAEARRLHAEHGPEPFRGLNLHGVVG